MTVKELIQELSKCNQDAEVETEGCDCYGDVGSVEEQTRTTRWRDGDWEDITHVVVMLCRGAE
jgi:hypothetical protein